MQQSSTAGWLSCAAVQQRRPLLRRGCAWLLIPVALWQSKQTSCCVFVSRSAADLKRWLHENQKQLHGWWDGPKKVRRRLGPRGFVMFLFFYYIYTWLPNSISAGEHVSGLLQLPAGRLCSAPPYQSAGGDGCKLDLLSGVSFNWHSWVGWSLSSCDSSSRSDNLPSEETPRRLAGKLWLLGDPLCVLIRPLDFSFSPAAGRTLDTVYLPHGWSLTYLNYLGRPTLSGAPPSSQMTRKVRSQEQPASLKTFQIYIFFSQSLFFIIMMKFFFL